MKKIVLIIAIILLLIIAFFIRYYIKPSEKENNSNTYNLINNTINNNQQKSPSEIKDEETQIILNRALTNNNPLICEDAYGHYSMMGNPYSYVDYCYQKFAISAKNLSVCGLIRGNKDDCYYTFAIASKEVSICDKISKSLIAGKEVTNILELECHAVIEKNYSYCSKIYSLEDSKKVSRDSYCYVLVAFEKNDLSGCDLADDSEYKNYCYAVINKDPSSCDNINNEFKSWCYYQYYLKTKDDSICSKTGDYINLCK